MLTGFYLFKSLFKKIFTVVLILMLITSSVWVYLRVKHWISDQALAYSHVLGQQYQVKICYRKVKYSFPKHIIFNDIKIYRLDQKTKPMFQSSRAVLDIVSGNILKLDDLNIDFTSLKIYWA